MVVILNKKVKVVGPFKKVFEQRLETNKKVSNANT